MGRGPGAHGYARPKNTKKTIEFLMSYIGKHKFLLVIVTICLFASSFAMVAGNYFLKPLVNDYIMPGDFAGLARMLMLMGGIYLVGACCSYGYSRIMVHISQQTVYEMRRDLFDKLEQLPLKYFDTHTHGELMSRVTNDIDTVSEAINNSFASLISNSLTFLGTLSMMIFLSPGLTLVSIVTISIMFLLIKVIGGKSRFYFGQQQQKLGAVNGYIEEMIEGQKVIKVFCHEEAAKANFKERNDALRQAAISAQSYAGIMMPMMHNLSHVNYAVTSCVGGLLAIGGALDLGSLISYLQYTRQVANPIAQFSQQINVILAALAGAERVYDVMQQQPEIDEGTVTLTEAIEKEDGTLEETTEHTNIWAWKGLGPAGTVVLEPVKGDVRFHDVVFGYNEDKVILHDISLFAKPGQKIAFVGSTGAGKTTITNLINRFYEIQSGTITYDGIDVRLIQKDSLRRSLGIVLQDTHLFTGTIADNIRYGKLDATDEEVIAAAKSVSADLVVEKLEKGYDSDVGESGDRLSTGEKQLISFARAVLADPRIFVLDEATSSIDTQTEQLIQKATSHLLAGRTSFVIAHRLSTIRQADLILVVKDGKITEQGTHAQLMAKKGYYFTLYSKQFEEEAAMRTLDERL